MIATREYLNGMNTDQLLSLKSAIEEKIEENYNLKENFYLHDKTDDYIYICVYEDGEIRRDYLGSRAYKRYLEDDRVVAIKRKTKDLFPTYEDLLEKETYKA